MKKDFQNLIDTLKNSIKTWEYFVNWDKVFSNSSEMEIILNKLNYLLGKEDLKTEFRRLYESNPDIVKAFPVLLAVREKQLEIFELSDGSFEIFNFSNNDGDFEKYYTFLEKTGLINLFKKEGIKGIGIIMDKLRYLLRRRLLFVVLLRITVFGEVSEKIILILR